MIDPYTGQRRAIPSADIFNQSRFKWGDVEHLDASQRSSFERGSMLTGAYGFDPSRLGQMGINPEVVRFGGGQTTYYRDPTTGALRIIPTQSMFDEAGYTAADVVNMAVGTRGQFEFGPSIGQSGEMAPTSREGAFGALGTVMMESTTGAILPAIHKIAPLLAQWKAAGDARYDLAIQAYGNALDPRTGKPLGGISGQYIDSIVRAATPQAGAFSQGQPSGSFRRIGFTGGRV
jgi:hypothetical protein